jgi:mono/diheme cytochrome c family protein
MKRMMRFQQYTMAVVAGLCVLTSCQRDYNDPGTEYAPNMYVSIPYEPLTQVEENKLTPDGANVLPPVPGTISRRNYSTKYVDEYGNEYDLGLMVYRTHPDSIEVAEKTLKNPLPATKQVIAEGKVLYERFCQPCHGAKGQGDGLVGEKYKGVANIAANKFNDGHIFHVITHGKGRMWPHASQLNPLERWKIVHYVHVLSGDLPESGIVPGQEESANGQSSDVAMAN